MSTERIYETGRVVSRSLFAVVERGDMPLDSGFGEAEIIEVENASEAPTRIRVDTVPQDTIVTSPDAAAVAAAAMQGLSNERNGELGFRVEYSAD